MSKVLIIYHSNTGNTKDMAKAIHDGAVSSGAKVTLKKAAEATYKDIMHCDIVFFGTPNHFSYMSGVMKDFFDRLWLNIGNRKGLKLYTVFVSTRHGQATEVIESIDSICEEQFNKWREFKFKKASQGIVTNENPSARVLQECREMGARLAVIDR